MRAAEPPWIAVEDESEEWLFLAAARPAAERARGVLAAAGDDALVAGLKLRIGGALGLPPSTPAMEAALSAAAESTVGSEICNPEAATLAAAGARLTVWTFENHLFWKNQLGDLSLAGFLVELADRLRVPPAILPWPALLVWKRTRREVNAAWKDCVRDRSAPTQGLKATTVTRGRHDPVAAAYRALVEFEGESKDWKKAPAEPVHELPSGRLMGFWTPGSTDDGGAGCWLATPAARGAPRCSWLLRSDQRKERVEEVLSVAELAEVRRATAVRVPGWAVRDLRPGTPAGLLVSRLADGAARVRLPLWIPNLESAALHFVLSLPGTIWVDGPAVPDKG